MKILPVSIGNSLASRFDSWINLASGFGTKSDKTTQGFYGQIIPLSDQELSALFSGSAFAAKCVDVVPREALRRGFELQDDDKERAKKRVDWLESRFDLTNVLLRSWIFARLYGGAKTWVGYAGGGLQNTPAPINAPITFLKDVDRRWLVPFKFYTDGPRIGEVETYNLFATEGRTTVLGEIHETRLIHWPGAMTERMAKISLNTWDYSFLQKPYEALRANGNIWKSIELLVNDANQAVYKIKNFFQMLAGKEGDALKTRVAAMDLVRSVARAIILDADGEDFTRQSTTFSGLADLDQQALKRLAAESDIPVMFLLGDSPTGLNATGDPTIRMFLSKVSSERTQVAEPRMIKLITQLLQSPECPAPLQAGETVSLCWPEMWMPTALEQAQIDKLRAETAQIVVNAEIVLPEEAAVSLYGGDNPLFKINLEVRQGIIDVETPRLLEEAKDPTPEPVPPAPGQLPAEKPPAPEPGGAE